MAEWAREGCCSFRCSRPSGSWRRFPAAEPAAGDLSLHVPLTPSTPGASSGTLAFSGPAGHISLCFARRAGTTALLLRRQPYLHAPYQLWIQQKRFQGLWVAAAETQVHKKIKDALYTWDWHLHTNSGMQNNCVELPYSFQGHRPRHLTNA